MLRPSSVNFVDSFPRRGSLDIRHLFKFLNDMLQSVTKRAMPAPPGGSLEIRHLFEFLNSLLQSVRETAPHPSPFGDTFPQGEGFKRGNHFAFKRSETVRYETGDARPRGEGFFKDRDLKFQTVCCNPFVKLPLITAALRGRASPRGEAYEIGRN